MRTASELRTKMEKMKTKRMEGIERVKTERIYNPDRDLSMRNRDKGKWLVRINAALVPCKLNYIEG